jgi:hypothetical protein
MNQAWRPTLLVGLVYLLLSVAFCWYLFEHPFGVGLLDWDQHLFYYAQVIKNVAEYGQAPFWSPWYCGGNVLWQNPQTALLSPVYPLTAIAGLPLAMKINIVLHYWIGFIGMHLLLTRSVGLTVQPLVVYLASLFVLAGVHAMHIAVGHSVFLPAFYLPWIVYFVLDAVRTGAVRPALYAGAGLALMIYNGSVHLVWMTIPAIACLGVGFAVAMRSWRPVAVALIAVVAGAAYAGPKLVPVVSFVTSDRFWDARDPTPRPDRMTADMMLHAYVDPAQDIGSKFSTAEQQHDWLEYGDYIGAIGTTLIGWGIVWMLLRPDPLGTPCAVIALLFLVLSAGEFSPFAPFTLLRRLPFFSSFRIPSRLTIDVLLFGVLAAAVAVRRRTDSWRARSGGPQGRRQAAVQWIAVVLMCAIGVVQLIVVNRAHFRGKFSGTPLEHGFRVLKGAGTLTRDVFVNPYTANAPMLRALMNDQAVMWCYEVIQLKRGADAERPLVWVDGPAKVSSVAFTPNRVEFSAIGGGAPTRVFLNQNYDSGWRSTAGPVHLDPQAGGRMYVELAAGQTGHYAFSYTPPGLTAGLVLLILAVPASRFAWNRRLS